MKVLTTFAFAFFCITSLFANVGDPADNDPGKKASLVSANSMTGVFFEDYSSGTIFIDFEGLVEPLAAISILKDGLVLFSDPVQDLPLNTIYELNTDLMRRGSYILELETTDGVRIQKDIRVE